MADSPRLAPTADDTGYAPYSLTAVLAVGVAGLFAAFMLAVAGVAFLSGQRFVMPVLLVFPVIAVVLSFAARRQIRSSEGTRAGLNLCDIAWWVAVLGGLGYLAYLVAVNVAIRTDAARRFDQWAEVVVQADPTAAAGQPGSAEFYRAFHMVIAPARQESIKASQADAMQKEFRDEVAWFRQSDIMRLAARNRGNMQFKAGSLQRWDEDPQQGMLCTLTATLTSPEGEVDFVLPMVRQVGGNGVPTWAIQKKQEGYRVAERLTRYGGLVRDLESSGMVFSYGLIAGLPLFGQNFGLLRELAKPADAPPAADALFRDAAPRMAAAGGPAWAIPAAADTEAFVADTLFAAADPTKTAATRPRFLAALRTGSVQPPGVISQSQNPVELAPVTTITDAEVVMRVPVEIQVSPNETACRGHIVIACADPAVLRQLKDLRAAAAGETPGEYKPQPVKAAWRLVRIESDLRPMPAQQRGPESPGGMGGM